ncbi:MAG TPA: hypothetical protein VK139_07050 [Microbacteriaceae bacterium]|nr:hypothetical protein [Microbacteriaceae bacterium]
MVSLRVHPDRLEVHLTPAEKALAAYPRDLVVPRTAIRSAAITHDPWVWLRGIRAPGTAIPRTLALGTWRSRGAKDFVLIKGSRPAVVLDLDPEQVGGFHRLVLSSHRVAELVASLRVDPPSDSTPQV